MGSEIVAALLAAVIGILLKMSRDLGSLKSSLDGYVKHSDVQHAQHDRRLQKLEASLPHCSRQCG